MEFKKSIGVRILEFSLKRKEKYLLRRRRFEKNPQNCFFNRNVSNGFSFSSSHLNSKSRRKCDNTNPGGDSRKSQSQKRV